MKKSNDYCVVMVTVPSLSIGRKIAKLALKTRLTACANLLPGLESHYWWRRKLERSREVLILFKTTTANLPELEQVILKNHPYDTPEFVAVPLLSGNSRYLEWLDQSVM